MTEKYYEAINWNDMEDRVDKSAWARLNDIILGTSQRLS
ncbi:hypothetical protein IMAU50019_01972 [Lactobacillus helveticus]|nr:hypothetical protein [Lactobacillus helveticus]NRN84023.1 hypothetical protein [Lactobacillus helveticus]NRN96605.1 hypothetical protein [Lactobacillus helveticus]NRO11161.1 hypothetical protein [Lactobacillus helveticus]NRO29227.1 hypothetical protein [Lactobacillus helveticus]